ncbi:uncharacterized protein N7503_009690 [Penicillium pulvis]|uniref:uncharacterized protein n=1 Tax=Penicillium pulvis TaxID=1562058 RepID=UPI00254940A5|nr:uncharacterized protein N7503_009690 [Penicillium pulvis]KAJ5784478.1 hypothetical protein N7503_009690 [Penicillium pulvis]
MTEAEHREANTTDKQITQGTNLKQSIEYEIFYTPIVLAGPLHDKWLADVKAVLQQNGLERLIDITIPHPKTTDASWGHWHVTSSHMRCWLAAGLPRRLLKKVNKSNDNVTYADGFMEVALKEIRYNLFNMHLKLTAELASLKGADFPTLKEYMVTFLHVYKRLQELQATPPSYYLLCCVYQQVQLSNDVIMKGFVRTNINSLLGTCGDIWTNLPPTILELWLNAMVQLLHRVERFNLDNPVDSLDIPGMAI